MFSEPLPRGLPQIPGLTVQPLSQARPQPQPRLQPHLGLDPASMYGRTPPLGPNSFLSNPSYLQHYPRQNGGYFDHMGYRQPEQPKPKLREPKAIVFRGRQVLLKPFSALPSDMLKLIKQKTKEPDISGLSGGYGFNLHGYGQMTDITYQVLEQTNPNLNQGNSLCWS